MLYLCLNEDGTGIVDDNTYTINTKHTNSGEPATLPLYVVNDGVRYGTNEQAGSVPLVYTGVQIKVEGVTYTLQSPLSASISDVNVTLSGTQGYNIGTILKAGAERMRVEEVVSNYVIRVTRNYTADGGSSTITGHTTGTSFVADTSTVSLALPVVSDYNRAGNFYAGGSPLTVGFDPTTLSLTIDSMETTNVLRSSNASKYSVNSIIKIDNEEMKITNIQGNEITVVRGYNNTNRTVHVQNAIIYCVGIADIGVAHKFFVKNDPPAGLPTQKKADNKLVLVANEEPL